MWCLLCTSCSHSCEALGCHAYKFCTLTDTLCVYVQVMCLWTKAGALEVVVLDEAAAASTQLEKVVPKNVLKSQGFSRALFELFLGEASTVPAARPVWAAGARELLESEIVKRDSRKGGSG